MTKAEEKALKEYPKCAVISEPHGVIFAQRETKVIDDDGNRNYRDAYIKGYEQAEKDMKITWRQIKYIVELEGNMDVDMFMGSQEYYEEMARRCNTVMMYGLQGDVPTEMEEGGAR